MVFLPVTTAIRTDTADMERAISSAKPITLDVFVPGAGDNSYSVITGPGRIFTIFPFTPNSCKTSSSFRAVSSSSFSLITLIFLFLPFDNKSTDGKIYPFLFSDFLTCLFLASVCTLIFGALISNGSSLSDLNLGSFLGFASCFFLPNNCDNFFRLFMKIQEYLNI